MSDDFIEKYFWSVMNTAFNVNKDSIEDAVDMLSDSHNVGRVFIIGMGGSAGNASHMANDLRKLCNIDAICLTDNVPYMTAVANDHGVELIFSDYLESAKVYGNDILIVLSVGGGDYINEKPISESIINAIEYANDHHMEVLSIVGKENGYAANHTNVVIHLPVDEPTLLTPISEAFQAIVWHCIVSHPRLQTNKTTW